MSRNDSIRCSAHIKGGEILINRDKWLDAELGGIEGEAVFLTLEPVRNRRSLKANAFLWGVIYKAIAEHTGDTPEKIHEHMKAKFLSEKHMIARKDTGELDEQTITNSTTRLSIMAFTEFIERIQAWCAEFLDLTVPPMERE